MSPETARTVTTIKYGYAMNRRGECLPFNAAIAREFLGGKGGAAQGFPALVSG